jgi:recyclin-1
MRDVAEASWRVWLSARVGLDIGGGSEDWEMGKVWADKREIFYEQGRWDPLANFMSALSFIFFIPCNTNCRSEGRLDFDAMDEFMTFVTNAIIEHGSRAVRIFPPESGVLIAFAERIASEVVRVHDPSYFFSFTKYFLQVGEYITTLLTRAREVSSSSTSRGTSAPFLQATAASFKEAWRMVDAVMTATKERNNTGVEKTRAEDVVYVCFIIFCWSAN